jgi:isocitrate dehydrogenase
VKDWFQNFALQIHNLYCYNEVHAYTAKLRASIHKLFREGRGTRDLCGAAGLTTEEFIDAVAEEMK